MRIALTLLLLTACATPAKSPEATWIQLFNGHDLTGWTPKITGYPAGENFANTFRVEDGLLKVGYDGYGSFEGRFGHLFFEEPFSNYRMRVEYRFVGEQLGGGPGWAYRNSGVMVHGQSPGSMAMDQDFPVSIEIQLLGGDGTHERSNANLCTPGTHVVIGDQLVKRHCTDSTSRTFHGDGWVTVEFEVRGNERIEHFIDGESVLSYSQPQLDDSDPEARLLISNGELQLSSGTISLQSESHPIEFRRVELLRLNPDSRPHSF